MTQEQETEQTQATAASPSPAAPPTAVPASDAPPSTPYVDPRTRKCYHQGGSKMTCDDQGCPWAVGYFKTRFKQAKLALKFAENVFANRLQNDPHSQADANSFKVLVSKLYDTVPLPGHPDAASMIEDSIVLPPTIPTGSCIGCGTDTANKVGPFFVCPVDAVKLQGGPQ